MDRLKDRVVAQRSGAALIRTRTIYAAIAVVYGLALAALVFLPLDPVLPWALLRRRGIRYTPVRELVLDVLVNIAVFVPVGILACGLWRERSGRRPATAAVVTAAAVGSAIELTQWVLGWRDASIQDALCNTVGGALGAALDRLFGPGAKAC